MVTATTMEAQVTIMPTMDVIALVILVGLGATAQQTSGALRLTATIMAARVT